ncbi:hypothetical protein [Amorphus coralli]|uniref:hypothetical protein n=1 Tax=Amorphus coralli TaxID=340680 RepID=UPI0003673BEF|nr:hypothetical protein [Amorphus coralli]
MFEDVDFERLATLRWSDPDEPGPTYRRRGVDGPLRVMLQRFSRLSREEQASASVTLSPEPGDWSATIIEGRELRQMARRHSSGRVLGFLEAAARLHRRSSRGPTRLEWPDGDTRLRNVG